MKNQNLKTLYTLLEAEVLSTLKQIVCTSNYESEHINDGALPIKFKDKVELIHYGGDLIFIDDRGSWDNVINTNLSDLINLINIIESNNKKVR